MEKTVDFSDAAQYIPNMYGRPKRSIKGDINRDGKITSKDYDALTTYKKGINNRIDKNLIPKIPLDKIEGYIYLASDDSKDKRVIAKFNVTSTDSYTRICSNTGFAEIEVDGVVMPSINDRYKFDTLGEHTVKYTLLDDRYIYGGAFYLCNNLTSIIIPNGVNCIYLQAFLNCANLTYVTLPKTMKEILSNVFNNCTSLKHIALPEGITSIGSSAFANCTALTISGLPSSLTYINYKAFSNTGLTGKLIIPGTVSTISESAFEYTNITELVLENGINSINSSAFQYSSNLSTIIINSATIPSSNMFYNCPNIKTVIINNNSVTSVSYYGSNYGSIFGLNNKIDFIFGGDVTTLGINMFYMAKNINSIKVYSNVTRINSTCFLMSNITSVGKKGSNAMLELPNSLSILEDHVFYNCANLKTVDLPDNITSIGQSCFLNCVELNSIKLPDNLTYIDYYAFDGCTALPTIDNVRYADTYAVQIIDTSAEKITLKEDTKFLGPLLFLRTRSMSSFGPIGSGAAVELPDSIVYLGISSMSNSGFECSMYIPPKTQVIDKSAFYSCSKINGNLIIPSTTIKIGDQAFYGCTGLESVVIGKNVSDISTNVLLSCLNIATIIVDSGNTAYDSRNNCNAIIETATNKLIAGCKNTVIPNTVTAIGNYAFSGHTSLTSITIPNNVTSIGSSAFLNTGLTSIVVPPSVSTINDYAFSTSTLTTVVDCSSVSKSGTYSYGYVQRNFGTNVVSYTLAGNNTLVQGYLFNKSLNLTTINLANTVTAINDNGFYGCTGLTSIELPNGVTSIGKSAFYSCTNLTTIKIPSGVTSIGDSAFGYCKSIVSVGPAGSNSSIELPNNITSLKSYLFTNCTSLVTVIIPNTVTTIYSTTFTGCTGLKNITLGSGYTTNTTDFYSMFPGKDIETITVDTDNTVYKSLNNAIIKKSNNEIVFGCKTTTIDSTVLIIGANAFRNNNIVSITIPSTVTSIGNYAFNSCSQLEAVYVERTTPPTLGSSVFNSNKNNRTIYVPAASVATYKAATNWKSYASYIEPIPEP